MKKKIGLVTLYKDNFGSILQCYATYSYLESLGYDCTVIDRPRKSCFELLYKICINIFSTFTNKYFLKNKIVKIMETNKDLHLLSYDTRLNMNEFIKNNFKIMKTTNRGLKEINDEFSAFIAGSDQIWNVSNGIDDFFYLSFAEKEKRIVLAPSFGIDQLPNNIYIKQLEKKLQGFNKLSVREETGCKIIKKLVGKNAIRIPDPTLIYNKEEWKSFASNGIQRQNYILLHFLNIPNNLAIDTVNRYLQIHDCEVICIVNNYEKYNQLGKYTFLDINPYDYISLILNSNFVFTDSFHSTLFSLNLEKEFVTFDRQYLHGNPQSSRLRDLLKRVHLLERYIVEPINNLECLPKWNKNIMSSERRLVRGYLAEELRSRK